MDKEGKPMAGEILPQDASNWQNWEEECYQEGAPSPAKRPGKSSRSWMISSFRITLLDGKW
ncbi:MAG: hypothetical protein DRI61_06085 [Chloroflexi bacterium]|nr:MAG: hypothetical protein DRI61_06085 [Chloroflexota bacterium]